MIKVGTEQFLKLPIERKISLLVNRGYKQAAFRVKANAEKFIKAWKKKGYDYRWVRSSGQVIEGGYQRNAYYVIVGKRFKK